MTHIDFDAAEVTKLPAQMTDAGVRGVGNDLKRELDGKGRVKDIATYLALTCALHHWKPK